MVEAQRKARKLVFGETAKKYSCPISLMLLSRPQYGARYYDPRTSVWQSADAILGAYLPTGDEKKDNNLRGMGGIFRTNNLGLYSYGFNNPVRLLDPDGNEVTMTSGVRRRAARQASAARGTTTMPELKPGVYPLIADSLAATLVVGAAEMGDIFLIDKENETVLHFSYAGVGPGAGLDAVASREFGAVYISDTGAGALEGLSLSGEVDGVAGVGGTGTLAIPIYEPNPQSTAPTGGPGVGVGMGVSVLGTFTWFKKAYSFDEAPPTLPNLNKLPKWEE